ncbi:MAG: nitronate monooxygenase [Gammaproteobacteria bacterium]|jgi:nitronate monooxygenase
MWPETTLLELFEVQYPIIQAPMAGSATVKLAAAVTNAGGLGSLGCGEMSPDELETKVGQLRQLTNGAFNLNFMVHPTPVFNPAVDLAARNALEPFYKSLNISETPTTQEAPFKEFNQEFLKLLLKLRAPIVSFHFGLPKLDWVKELQASGCVVISSATTVEEAVVLDQAGIDAIIAQGWEAGGHRGSFDTHFEDAGTGTMALVPQVVDQVDVPVIAAGGIADGRGIAASFMLGACGVQMGTAFLSCPEAATSEAHCKAIRESKDTDTRLTRAFSGRPARARNNPYIESMAKQRQQLPDYPTLYNLSMPLHLKSEENETNFLLYGQAAALNRELPAAQLIETLVTETTGILS